MQMLSKTRVKQMWRKEKHEINFIRKVLVLKFWMNFCKNSLSSVELISANLSLIWCFGENCLPNDEKFQFKFAVTDQ